MAALTTDLSRLAERPGATAKVRFVRMSASKVRVVLNLVRGKRVDEAFEILQFTERLAAHEVTKALRSAVHNAGHNEDIPESELYVSVAFADEGPAIKRFRPRARGRAGRINKQTCHITITVSRMSETELDDIRQIEELKAKGRSSGSTASTRSSGGDRAARVAKSKAAQAAETNDATDDVAEEAEAEQATAEAEGSEATEAADEVAGQGEVAADEATDDVDDSTDAGDDESGAQAEAGEEE